MTVRVNPWQRGERITANKLNRSVSAIGELQGSVFPRQLDAGTEFENQMAGPEGETWTLTAWSTITVRVFQDGDETSDNWVDVERDVQLTFATPRGPVTLIDPRR